MYYHAILPDNEESFEDMLRHPDCFNWTEEVND